MHVVLFSNFTSENKRKSCPLFWEKEGTFTKKKSLEKQKLLCPCLVPSKYKYRTILNFYSMTTISHIFKSATYGGTTLEKKLVALSKVLLIVALLNVPLRH